MVQRSVWERCRRPVCADTHIKPVVAKRESHQWLRSLISLQTPRARGPPLAGQLQLLSVFILAAQQNRILWTMSLTGFNEP